MPVFCFKISLFALPRAQLQPIKSKKKVAFRMLKQNGLVQSTNIQKTKRLLSSLHMKLGSEKVPILFSFDQQASSTI
jgi:hypothetical protein